MTDHIYCDQAATSFPKPPEVIKAVSEALSVHAASPGRSAHHMSLMASRIVFQAREALADLLGADDSSQIVFTLNVTQALNMALTGFLEPGDHVLTTPLEHNSVMRPLSWLSRTKGVEVEAVPLGDDGLVAPDDFAKRIKSNTRLAVTNHASNVTGAICPVGKIKTCLGDIPLLVDAAQSAGAIPLAPDAGSAPDMIAFTGHKGLLGPTGVGGLWSRPGLEIAPLVRGGTGSRSELEEQPEFMPDRLEAGTPNTHGLAGLAAGVEFILDTGLEAIREHELNLLKIFLDGLSQIPEAIAYGPADPHNRTAVISLNLEDWSPSDLAHALDREYGIMTRAGLHCAPRAHRTIGTFPQGTVRFSFGWYNTADEVNLVLEALGRLAAKD